MNCTLWVEESLKLSQSAAHQRQMDQLSILIEQQHRELRFPGLNRQEGRMRAVKILEDMSCDFLSVRPKVGCKLGVCNRDML